MTDNVVVWLPQGQRRLRERAYKMQKTKCATLSEQLEAESATRWKVSRDREGKDRKHKDWWSGRKW